MEERVLPRRAARNDQWISLGPPVNVLAVSPTSAGRGKWLCLKVIKTWVFDVGTHLIKFFFFSHYMSCTRAIICNGVICQCPLGFCDFI